MFNGVGSTTLEQIQTHKAGKTIEANSLCRIVSIQYAMFCTSFSYQYRELFH